MDEILQDPVVIELRTNTEHINHNDGVLFDHLYGTYQILKQWNKPDYVCMAGLFHSVYETEYFSFDTTYTRDKVIGMLGKEAEKLVYEFCRIKPRINVLISKTEDWSNTEYMDLIDIELANMKEQGYYNQEIKILEAIRKNLK